MLDFIFATSEEIRLEIGSRLKTQRLARGWSQIELAGRAAVAKGTLQNLENKGVGTLDSFIRVVLALDLSDQLQTLFNMKVQSIAQMEAAEKAKRLRAPRKPRQP